jgi:hypothetical protein
MQEGSAARRATDALVFGLLSVVCGALFFLFSPLAIYHGSRALREMSSRPGTPGRASAVAGICLGIISAILWLIVAFNVLPNLVRHM